MDIRQYVIDLRTILKYIDFDKINEIVDMLQVAHKRDKRIYVIGNGGSATTASHIAGDLNKTAGLRAMALADSNYLITSYANDCGYEKIFNLQLRRFLKEGDVVIVLSGSGTSPNIIAGLDMAKDMKAKRIALLGSGGGMAVGLTDISLIVPSDIMEQIEDIHLVIGHILVMELNNRQKPT